MCTTEWDLGTRLLSAKFFLVPINSPRSYCRRKKKDLYHGLTSLKISNIVDYLKSTFLWFRKLLSMQKHTILLYCRLSTINIFIVYCNPLYRENDNNYQVSAEIPIIGIFTRSWPRKFVSLSNLLDIRRMFIWRERPVSRELHFKFRRIWFTANMLLKLSSVSYSQLPFSLSLQRLKFL